MSIVDSVKHGLGVKIHGIPVVVIAAPVIILGVLASARKGATTTDAGLANATQNLTGSGGFSANLPASNMAYIDPVTGRAIGPDGTVYNPIVGGPVAAPTPTPQDPPATTTPPATAPTPTPPVNPSTPVPAAKPTVNTAPNWGWFDSRSKNNTTKNVAAAFGITEKALLDLNPNLKSGAVPLGYDVKVRSTAAAKTADIGTQYHPTQTPVSAPRPVVTPAKPPVVATPPTPAVKAPAPKAPPVQATSPATTTVKK